MDLVDDELVNEELSQPFTEDISEPNTTVTKYIDNPQLSLQALYGVPNYQTMRISALHNKNSYKSLLIVEVPIISLTLTWQRN
jgi:hypothetical protein